MENAGPFGSRSNQQSLIQMSTDAFLRMLVGMRQLIRRDIPQRGLRGLYDAETGEWFVIEESQLFLECETRLTVRERQT